MKQWKSTSKWDGAAHGFLALAVSAVMVGAIASVIWAPAPAAALQGSTATAKASSAAPAEARAPQVASAR